MQKWFSDEDDNCKKNMLVLLLSPLWLLLSTPVSQSSNLLGSLSLMDFPGTPLKVPLVISWPSSSSNLVTHLVTPWPSSPTQLPKKPHTLLSLGRRCRPHDLQPETLMTPPPVSRKTFSTFIGKLDLDPDPGDSELKCCYGRKGCESWLAGPCV